MTVTQKGKKNGVMRLFVFLFLVSHCSDFFVWAGNLAWLKNCKGTMKKQLSQQLSANAVPKQVC